ncbi:MAG: serine/threonine transporter SstT [Clostridia bacterium]|jgi:serine/threonine transporter|nr:serine/threonine transporter SstT [Clostridia bacterium]
MKAIGKIWNGTSLIVKILIGLALGTFFGLLTPQATFLTILGDLFVGALKGIAPLLVFVLVISSLANAAGSIGKRFTTVIALYLASTLIASVIAVIASFLFPMTIKLATGEIGSTPPSGLLEIFESILGNIVQNPITAIGSANYVGVLAWAVMLGLAFKAFASPNLKLSLQNISDTVSQVVRWIIGLAPFGILGLVFTAVSTSGLSIFVDYGRLLLLLVGTMAFVTLVSNPLIVGLILRRNPYPLVFKCLRESGITAFFTRSSAANIPVNMSLCERLGLDKDFYSVSIPLGATINMDGAAVVITIMTLAAAHTLGVSVSFVSAIVLSILATLGACGTSGVAGGSLLLIPMACSMFGINNDIAMQVVAVGFIISVIQDSCETAINSSGDVLFTATAEFREWIKEGRKLPL